MTDEMLNELFDRMRETEAQTREQQVRIEALTGRITEQNERLESFSKVVDKFISSIAEREDRSETREKSFWKVIYIMLGTIVTLALGPKVAKELFTQQLSSKIPVAAYIKLEPIAPMPDYRPDMMKG